MRRALLAAAAVACATPPPAPPAPPHRPPPAASAAPAPTPPAAWIEDDYPRALAEAKRSGAPLLVDASAVWCHTCKAMRAYVLDDPSLPRPFVRLSIDIEKPENAAACEAFPAHVLPTFFVVDPRDASIHGRWEGAASVRQMRGFLTDAARSIALAHASQLRPDDPLAILLSAQRAAIQKKWKDAAAAYARALDATPATWPHAPEALLGLLEAQHADPGACAATAERGLGRDLARLGRTSVLADFGSEALDCVEQPAEGGARGRGGEKRDDARAKRVRELVAKDVADLAGDARAPLSPDDRSDAWHIVWEAREALGDHAGALAAARARLDVIEKAVAARPDPTVTTTYDGARMETLEFLGRREDAARFLEAQEKALPDDYNPPHRLAHVYYAMHRYPDALAAIRRAIAKGYGARKGLMLRLEADILLAMGRKADARKALEAQLALYRSLPEGQKKPAFEKAVQKRIDSLK
jgi:hypothetical protein